MALAANGSYGAYWADLGLRNTLTVSSIAIGGKTAKIGVKVANKLAKIR